MKLTVVEVPSIKVPITRAEGFAKKGLADYKLDLMALCGYSCSYCSSTAGNYLRINRKKFADLTEAQIGERLPATTPGLTMIWPDVLEKLEAQVLHQFRTNKNTPRWGEGHTLVFSMLTDGFSPLLVGDGTTEKALRLVLRYTSFRIRILTKNAVVGSPRWIKLFLEVPGRFVVGLSCGTLDRAWAEKVEIGTSSPAARLAALHALQDAGVPTFGMLCPVFVSAAYDAPQMAALVAATRPERCETVWAEPENDRDAADTLRLVYPEGSEWRAWYDRVYPPKSDGKPQARDTHAWSIYATTLYRTMRQHAEAGGWLDRLIYLLYENDIAAPHALQFADFRGVSLQSKPREDGKSSNPFLAALQRDAAHGRIRHPRSSPMIVTLLLLALAAMFFFTGWLWRSRAAAIADRNALAQSTADALLAASGTELRIRLREVRFALLRLGPTTLPGWIRAMVEAVRRQTPMETAATAAERVPDRLPPQRAPLSATAEVRPPAVGYMNGTGGLPQ